CGIDRRLFQLSPAPSRARCDGDHKNALFWPKAPVTFWTADLRVTAPTRIVLIMIRAPPWSWQVPTRRGPTGGAGGLAGGGVFFFFGRGGGGAKKEPAGGGGGVFGGRERARQGGATRESRKAAACA